MGRTASPVTALILGAIVLVLTAAAGVLSGLAHQLTIGDMGRRPVSWCSASPVLLSRTTSRAIQWAGS